MPLERPPVALAGQAPGGGRVRADPRQRSPVAISSYWPLRLRRARDNMLSTAAGVNCIRRPIS